MLEMRFVRENIELVKENLKKRNSDYNVDELLSFDVKRRELLQEVEVLKKERNWLDLRTGWDRGVGFDKNMH